jgi:hypothetical protein
MNITIGGYPVLKKIDYLAQTFDYKYLKEFDNLQKGLHIFEEKVVQLFNLHIHSLNALDHLYASSILKTMAQYNDNVVALVDIKDFNYIEFLINKRFESEQESELSRVFSLIDVNERQVKSEQACYYIDKLAFFDLIFGEAILH